MNALNLVFRYNQLTNKRGDMSYYEHVFIARPEVAPQQVENVVEDIKKIVSNEGGKTVYTEYWGLRKLAYKINKSEKGHYSLLRIDSSNNAIIDFHKSHNEKTICYCNGGDRSQEDKIREAQTCKTLGIDLKFGIGGIHKLESSSNLTKNHLTPIIIASIITIS